MCVRLGVGRRTQPAYNRRVPAQRIAENLAFINWTVLTGLAVGAFAAVVLGRLATTATRGYLAFTAACAVGLGGLAYLSDTGLPAAIAGAAVRSDASWDGPRRIALVVFVGASAAYTIALASGRRAPALAVLALTAGGATLVTGAIGWAGGPVGPVGILFLVVQLGLLAAATGGVFAAMILGHWYLVTPKLPEAPLVLFSRALFTVVAIQLVLFVAWVAAGTGGGGPFGALGGPWALFVWLRLIVGLGFPLIVSWAAIQTARSRSMESATGLLYINVGSIAAGTILAAGLYFGAGMLV
jgi:hypothetical protein